eukprot:COSAG02_NODE_3563_length_6554_cov_7.849419_1_plen_579_part_00
MAMVSADGDYDGVGTPSMATMGLPQLLESYRKARTPTSAAKQVSRAEALDSVSSLRKLLNRPVNTTPTGFVTVQKVLFTPMQKAAAPPARRKRTEELVSTLLNAIDTGRSAPPRTVATLAERCTSGKGICKTARTNGAVRVFVALLDAPDPLVQEHCCHGLAAMVALDGRPSARALHREGGEKKLAALANGSYVASLREAAAWALTALTIKGGAEGYDAVDRSAKGGVQPVLDVLCQEESRGRTKLRNRQHDGAVVLQSLCRRRVAFAERDHRRAIHEARRHNAAVTIQRMVRQQAGSSWEMIRCQVDVEPTHDVTLTPVEDEGSGPDTSDSSTSPADGERSEVEDDPFLAQLGLGQYTERLRHLGDLRKVLPEKIGSELAKAGVGVKDRRKIFEALARLALSKEAPLEATKEIPVGSPSNWLRDELRRRRQQNTKSADPAKDEQAAELKAKGVDDDFVQTWMNIAQPRDSKLKQIEKSSDARIGDAPARDGEQQDQSQQVAQEPAYYCRSCRANFQGSVCPAAHPIFVYTKHKDGAVDAEHGQTYRTDKPNWSKELSPPKRSQPAPAPAPELQGHRI